MKWRDGEWRKYTWTQMLSLLKVDQNPLGCFLALLCSRCLVNAFWLAGRWSKGCWWNGIPRPASWSRFIMCALLVGKSEAPLGLSCPTGKWQSLRSFSVAPGPGSWHGSSGKTIQKRVAEVEDCRMDSWPWRGPPLWRTDASWCWEAEPEAGVWSGWSLGDTEGGGEDELA